MNLLLATKPGNARRPPAGIIRLVLVATMAATIFFSPTVSSLAAPGTNPDVPAVSFQGDDESPQIVPSDEPTAAEGGSPASDPAATSGDDVVEIDINLGGEASDESSDDVVEIELNVDAEKGDDPEPIRFTGIISTQADLQPNQWMGAMDGRLVEPFAAPPQPVHVRSDAIGLDADITVREIINGEMQTPVDENEVSWYKETGSPGVRGTNMVLAGHLNWYTTPYAVFHNIEEFRKGDRIVITGEGGFEYIYEVRWVKLFDDSDADMDALVGPTTKASLTLVTCGGEWDTDAGQYGKRTVVRAQLVT